MDTNKQAKSCTPAVMRLKNEYRSLSTEINLLNRELLGLKNLIRDKQKNLRKINIAIIQKATRGPFLSLVPSSPNERATFKANDTGSKN